MGKGNTTKKGKQKVTQASALPTLATVPSSPPSPLPPSPPSPQTVSSPPAALHIQQSSATVEAIEAQEFSGHLGGIVEGAEEESWQDVRADDGWAAENSNEDVDDEGWESGLPRSPMPPSSLQPPQNKSGDKDHAKSYHPHQQPHLASSNRQIGHSASAHSNPAAGWGHTKSRQPRNAWVPANDGWADDDELDDQEDEDDAWGADDGWDNANNGWGQQQGHSAAWHHAVSAHSAHSQTRSRTPTSGWQSWGEEARRLPKVTFDPTIPPSPGSTQSKPVLSQLQRSQLLNTLLNNPQQTQQPYPIPQSIGASFRPTAVNSWQQYQPSQHINRHLEQQLDRFHAPPHGHDSQRNKNKPQRQGIKPHPPNKSDRQRVEVVHDVWGLGDGWSDLHDDEEQDGMTQDAWGRRVHFSPSALRASMLPSSAPSLAPSAVVENFTVDALPHNKLGLSTIPMSKTLSYAYSGTTPSTESEPGRAAMQRITDVHFIESRGEALKGVQHAFYGKQRKAADRFYWLFPPDKDERVSSLLNWINSMSFGIASFGLQKFLQTRERGALIVNAAYRPVHSPNEPAFDWVTWNKIQLTMDRILQESVGYYNPAVHIIVFVFLPSPSGNSVAIWRRKLPIPNNIRLAYQAQITQAMASLRKEYPVLVDELPPPPTPTPPPPPPKKKRKWYKLWLSS